MSVARGQGLNRQSVALFYELLRNELIKYNLEKMPQNIYNMDESGIQLINKPGSVIAGKGSKDVHVITSKEKGESVTVVACNNAEGYFLPPVLIIKGKNKKAAFEQDLSPGSKVYMNQKSSYINSDIFMLWLKEHFVPRKSPGKCILLLDGHASHCNDPDMPMQMTLSLYVFQGTQPMLSNLWINHFSMLLKPITIKQLKIGCFLIRKGTFQRMKLESWCLRHGKSQLQ